MFRSLTLPAAALALLSAASLRADDAVLGQTYGSGVHAYFSRDYLSAYEYLTSAIEAGSTDPRCHYFRGLTYLKLGREPEAEMDFAKGAELESRDVDAFYDVARSLGRIQGSTRLMIERYRVKARMAALKHAEEVHRARYEATRAEEPRVLHPPLETAPGLPGEASAKPGVQLVPKPVPKPIPEDIFESNPVQPLQPEKTGGQPPESPFETSPTGKKPVIEPAPGPTGGPIKSGSIFSALGKALGKAVTGDRQLPPLPIGPGMQPDEGGSDPFQLEPKVGPPPNTPLPAPPGPPPKAPPATPPNAPSKAPPEVPDDPFADQPPGTPSTEPVAEPPAKSGGEPSAEPAEEPSPEPPGNDPFGN